MENLFVKCNNRGSLLQIIKLKNIDLPKIIMNKSVQNYCDY
jgi:hypothetical protein